MIEDGCAPLVSDETSPTCVVSRVDEFCRQHHCGTCAGPLGKLTLESGCIASVFLTGIVLCLTVYAPAGPPSSTSVSSAMLPDAFVRPPGTKVLSDAEAAARVMRSSWEPRRSNERANRTVPTVAELAAFRRASRGQGIAAHVAGGFTGTTGEIIEWAAHKWGISPDVLRAQAAAESSWDQDKIGDQGRSFGLMQIKRTIWRGSYPLSRNSTAFNVDLAAAILRQAYDGRATWYKPAGYGAGDQWASLGAYYSGRWGDAEGDRYVERVWRHLVERSWARPGF
jgi:soluble lytic murein transglycosylase-like protein